MSQTNAQINRNRKPVNFEDGDRKIRLQDQAQRLETFNTLVLTTLREVKQFIVYGTRGSHAERDLLKKINKVIA